MEGVEICCETKRRPTAKGGQKKGKEHFAYEGRKTKRKIMHHDGSFMGFMVAQNQHRPTTPGRRGRR
jgi:hypothetical protein